MMKDDYNPVMGGGTGQGDPPDPKPK